MHIHSLPLPVQKIYNFWGTIFQNTNIAAEKWNRIYITVSYFTIVM